MPEPNAAIDPHPDGAVLAAFVSGRLDHGHSEVIEGHLLTCAICVAMLDRLPVDDAFVDNLRDASHRPKAPAPAMAPGTRFGSYVIDHEIGRGGIGVVYQAMDTRLQRAVALKVIPEGVHADPAGRERLRREAEITAGLHHPGIVQIYEIGEHEGCLYLALELLRPDGLNQLSERRARPVRWSAAVIRQLAETVDHAHRQGLVHRDLKPANILLDSTRLPEDAPAPSPGTPDEAVPRLKITDFGLALHRGQTGGLTRAGIMLGTPDYMAPEQIPGGDEAVGPAADIYSLGVMLYEMLTGRRPFESDDILRQTNMLRSNDPVPPRAINRGLPRDLENVCLKCLEKKPGNRYASASELAGDLELFLADEPVRATPPALHRRLLGWARRKPMLAITLVLDLSLYLVHLGIVASGLPTPTGPGFSTFISVTTPLVALYAFAVQKIYESPGREMLGAYLFAALPPIILFSSFAVSGLPATSPIGLYLLAIPVAAMIRPTTGMVWFMTGFCFLSYSALCLTAGPPAPGQIVPPANFISLLCMGGIMHLFLRRTFLARVIAAHR